MEDKRAEQKKMQRGIEEKKIEVVPPSMDLDQAIILLKRTVKFSAVPGQKHLDLGLVSVDELPVFEKALELANRAVQEGVLTREQLLNRLGMA